MTDESQPSQPESSDELSLEQLCSLYNNDNEHGSFVAKMAKRVFDDTREIHELGGDARRLLEAGALLHNLGLYFGVRDHNVCSMGPCGMTVGTANGTEDTTGATGARGRAVARVLDSPSGRRSSTILTSLSRSARTVWLDSR